MDEFQATDGGEFCKRSRCIEESRERLPDGQGSGPVQIAKDRAGLGEEGYGGNGRELPGGILPGAAVKDETVDPAPEFSLHGSPERGLPPEGEGKVGIKMGKDDALERSGGLAREAEGDLLTADGTSLGASRIAVHADPGLGGAA